MDIFVFALRCRLEEVEGKCCKVPHKRRMWEAGSLTSIVIALCSGRPCARHYPSVLFVIIKSRHAICLPRQHAAVLATPTLCVLPWLTLGLKHFMFAPLFSQWYPTKGSHQARGSVIYKDYQRNMMLKGKLQLFARPTGRQGWEAAQTEWMYLLFMWKSMGADRWRFVSSLFTPRLLDKCPRRPSWADGAQVSRKPCLPFPPQIDDRCASYRPVSFSLNSYPFPAVDLTTANSLELVSKEKLYLFNKLLHQINIFIFILIRSIGHLTL